MSDQFRPPIVDPLNTAEHADADAAARREEARERGLPEHEIDDDETVGGGVLSSGGTAIDRGTGTLGGLAQNRDRPRAEDEDFDGEDVADRVVPEPAESDRTAPERR
jgi:hypothetical protein